MFDIEDYFVSWNTCVEGIFIVEEDVSKKDRKISGRRKKNEVERKECS